MVASPCSVLTVAYVHALSLHIMTFSDRVGIHAVCCRQSQHEAIAMAGDLLLVTMTVTWLLVLWGVLLWQDVQLCNPVSKVW